jgi:hypothetical protein
LKRHKFFFLNLIEFSGQIVYNIDTEATNFRMNFAPQANFLQVHEQKKDRKNEIGDLGAPKSRGPLAVAQIAIP